MNQDYPRDIAILRYINSHDRADPESIAKALDARESFVERRLEALAEKGLLERGSSHRFETTRPGEKAIEARSGY